MQKYGWSRQKGALAALVCVLFISTAACGKKGGDVSDTSRTEFLKKGSIKVTSVESFEREYYNATELENQIDEAVKPYGKAIKKNRFQVKNKTAQLVMTYASDDDFRSFNETALYYGTIRDALADGADFSAIMGAVSLGNDPHIMNASYLESLGDKTCIVIPYPGEIVYEKRVLYASSKVQVMEDGQAFVMADVSEETPGILIFE